MCKIIVRLKYFHIGLNRFNSSHKVKLSVFKPRISRSDWLAKLYGDPGAEAFNIWEKSEHYRGGA